MKQKQNTLQNNNNTKTTTKSTKKSGKIQSRKIINWGEYNKALAKRGDITSFVINTDCNVHDNTQLLPSLIQANINLEQVHTEQNLEAIIGDGAYDANFNYHLANKLNAKFIAPPKRNANLRVHKDYDKNKFVDDVGWEDRNLVVRRIKYGEGLEAWKAEVGYHRRSLNENVFFRLKTIFGERMMYRCMDSCKTEQLIRARILNIFTSFGLPKYGEIAN